MKIELCRDLESYHAWAMDNAPEFLSRDLYLLSRTDGQNPWREAKRMATA